MNWNIVCDLLPGLMVLYICVGIVVGTSLMIYFICKEKLDRENFCHSVESIIYYGPAALILGCWGLKKLVKFLWTRDYKGWFNRMKEDFQAWNKARKKARKDLKEFKAKQKK